jgi:cytochrome c
MPILSKLPESLCAPLARCAAVIALVLCAASPARAETPEQRRGLRFLHLHCARCHAVGKADESPLPPAPPLRALHLKYPVADLRRPLARGVHPIMPRFELEPSEVEDIMAYLKTLE